MTVLFVSSTEPRKLRNLLPPHTSSTLPERYGGDIAWPCQGGWFAIQRKAIPDFIASVQDGRLAKEIGQLQQTIMPIVILEGRISFGADGLLALGRHGTNVTQKQYRGMVYSLSRLGVTVLHSKDHAGTAAEVAYLMEWSAKERHNSLLRRPGPVGRWGKADNREYQEHLIMGVPGVGPELAGRILDKFGKVPMQWTVDASQLMEVEGIGKMKAAAMLEALG